MSFKILHWLTEETIYESASAETLKQALEEAVKAGASLDGASLDGARFGTTALTST